MSGRPVRNEELGKFVKAHRTAKGWSMRHLAKLCDVDVSFVSLLEAGRVGSMSSARLTRLGEALDANMADLYSLTGYTAPIKLPSFVPYLRATSGLPEVAVQDMQDHLNELRRKYEGNEAGPQPYEDGS